MSNQAGPAKQRGCFFYGCLSLAILSLVVALFIGVGVYFAKRYMDGLVNDYTSATPEKIEELVYPEPKMRELQTRLDSFRQGVDKGTEGLELVLSADDLNALISQNRDLKGKIFVKIDDDQVRGQVSAPLPDIPVIKLKGRYLNGSAAFKIALKDGRLDVRIDQVIVKDKPVPPVILDELKKQDLAKEMQKNPEANKVMNQIESLEIRDGKVFIRNKPASKPDDSAPTPVRPAPAPVPATPR
jgi:hypothetical protein